jgi:hypothetical protein
MSSHYTPPYHLEQYPDGYFVVVDDRGHHHNAYRAEYKARAKRDELNDSTRVQANGPARWDHAER